MSILHALSTIPFFININQGIDRTLALLEVKEKNATLKGQPVLIDCINLMLRSLTVLENELTAIVTDTDTATDATIATAIATDTATTAIATDTATTAIDDDFQLVTFEEMADYLFFQQSWKMIKDPSLAMKGQGYLSDRVDSTAWSFNKVLPIYYDKENKMIIVKSGLNFYGCIASYSSIDDLKWQFAHNLLYDLKHCNATATDTTIATAIDTTIATAIDTAIATVKTETEGNRALSKFQKLWYLQQIDYPEIEQLKGIASINAAITSVSTFMSAHKAVTNHAVPEKDPNKKSAKSDKQTIVATANISDMESIVNVPESDLIALPSTIKVNGVVEIKKH